MERRSRSMTNDFISANIFTAKVETNCPQGGDAGHGGITSLEIEDQGGTSFSVVVDGEEIDCQGSKLELRFYGDCENETFRNALKWSGGALDRLTRENEDPASRPQPVSSIKTGGCSVSLLTYPATGEMEVAPDYGPDDQSLDFTLRSSVPDFLKWVDMLAEVAAELRNR